VQVDILGNRHVHGDQLCQDTQATLGYACDYISNDPSAFAAIEPRVENCKVLVGFIEAAIPEPGALWLAEAMAKQIPKLLLPQASSQSPVGLQCAMMLANLSVRFSGCFISFAAADTAYTWLCRHIDKSCKMHASLTLSTSCAASRFQ
jgi:hypothetical protein